MNLRVLLGIAVSAVAVIATIVAIATAPEMIAAHRTHQRFAAQSTIVGESKIDSWGGYSCFCGSVTSSGASIIRTAVSSTN